jgi:hypothetical protein
MLIESGPAPEVGWAIVHRHLRAVCGPEGRLFRSCGEVGSDVGHRTLHVLVSFTNWAT